jgi:predicted phage tail component-like protein
MPVAVNLPTTIGGFKFKGVHSSEYGVRATSTKKVLMPQLRRNLLTIPGRSSVIVESDGEYALRKETIQCSYVKQEGVNLKDHVRAIAGWLNGEGELSFDNDPEIFYRAFLSNTPPTKIHLEYATFELEFTFNHPFGYSTQEDSFSENLINGDTIDIEPDGSIETPCLIIIENVGLSDITDLKLTLRIIE